MGLWTKITILAGSMILAIFAGLAVYCYGFHGHDPVATYIAVPMLGVGCMILLVGVVGMGDEGRADDKWRRFKSPKYRLQDLGRPAVFLIPMKKLRQEHNGMLIEKRLHNFLITNFGAFTTSSTPDFGVWKDFDQNAVVDDSRRYTVAFKGKEYLSPLIEELAQIAILTKEDCVYLEAGQYSTLVYPE